MRSTREGAVKWAASPDIHSRCWLDLVEPGPVVLGAGFSCLFLQVWCLMLIPPHVPWVLSKHTKAGDSASRPALPPARLSLSLPPLVAHPPTLQEQQAASPLLLTCHQSCCPECLCGATRQASCSLSSFALLFHAFPPPSNLCLLLGLNSFDEGLCSHRCSTGSATGWDRPVVALVTQSCSMVI